MRADVANLDAGRVLQHDLEPVARRQRASANRRLREVRAIIQS